MKTVDLNSTSSNPHLSQREKQSSAIKTILGKITSKRRVQNFKKIGKKVAAATHPYMCYCATHNLSLVKCFPLQSFYNIFWNLGFLIPSFEPSKFPPLVPYKFPPHMHYMPSIL